MNKYENIYVGQDAILGDLGFLLVKFYAIFFYEVCRDRRLGKLAKQIFGKSWEFGPRRGGGLTQSQLL